MIVIDYREKTLLQHLKNLETQNIEYTTENLPVADIKLVKNEKNILIERKTLNDLWNSITTDRYIDQKQRLLETRQTHPNISIVYILEGNLDTIPNIYKKMTYGTMINNQFTHDIKILISPNIETTWYYIQNIYSKFVENSNDNTNTNTNTDNANTVLTLGLSKNDKIKHNLSCLQLMLIKGVSSHIAKSIIQHYPNISKLVLEYQKHSVTENQNLLKDITFQTSKTSKPRKIGIALSRKIYETFTESI